MSEESERLDVDGGIFTLPWRNTKVGRPWLAKLSGLDPKFGFKREFADTIVLQWHKSRPVKLGVPISFFQEGSYYEGKHPSSWGYPDERYYFKVIKKTDTDVFVQYLKREEIVKTFMAGQVVQT